ncbi:Protein CBG26336 [Caenorhabditis briggsae]|uniref:Protein CBG26336 n=1 Tax=Caenorhabditis briggsae TaxID=6238 RepID=B6IGA8_CAEBR|nr:Protein CBG26336 [Caenorhabditis briggsae]CAR98938.1 Protein CBG26336 [Caenorhabditis briggsae]
MIPAHFLCVDPLFFPSKMPFPKWNLVFSLQIKEHPVHSKGEVCISNVLCTYLSMKREHKMLEKQYEKYNYFLIESTYFILFNLMLIHTDL